MSAHALGQLLLALACVIVLARALGMLARRLGQPPVIGEILAGVLIGPTLFGSLITDRLFPMEIRPAMSGLATIGLVLFMFIVGYELDLASVRSRQRAAVSISIGSIVAPLGLGVALAYWLADNHNRASGVLPFALFIGAAMAVTAFPVLARILTDRGMLRTELGGIALACGAVDDIVAWSLLAVVVTIGAADGALPWQLLFAVPYILVMVFWVRPLLRRLAQARQRAGRLTPDILAVILAGLLLSCFVTEWLGVHAIFGAFLFGAVMPRLDGAAMRHEILERLEQVSVIMLLPMFFVLAGLRVDLSVLDRRGFVELLAILGVAITGKFAGAYLGARLHGIGPRPAGALATLMNTRGLTEIVILTVGLQLGIIDDELFSMMVVMALVTTAMAGPLLTLIYPRKLVERDAIAAQRAALGVPEAYRVLAVVPVGELAEPVIGVAADLAEPQPHAEVVLSRLLRYPGAPIEIGSGLSGELLEMTATMRELADLAAPVRARGLAVRVHARFSADLAGDLALQLTAAEPHLLVAGPSQPVPQDPGVAVVIVAVPPPVGWSAVCVEPGADGEAATRIAGQLAAARGVGLVVLSGGGSNRKLASMVRELTRRGVDARLAEERPPAALLVAGDGDHGDGVHLIVRGTLAMAVAGVRAEPPRTVIPESAS